MVFWEAKADVGAKIIFLWVKSEQEVRKERQYMDSAPLEAWLRRKEEKAAFIGVCMCVFGELLLSGDM